LTCSALDFDNAIFDVLELTVLLQVTLIIFILLTLMTVDISRFSLVAEIAVLIQAYAK
jgi:hypothetical protein